MDYFIRRFILVIPTFIGITLLCFALIQFGPGGPIEQASMQMRAWGNIPILNEWKRRYPDQDPVKLHARFWQAEPVCPGGGRYVWNDRWQTMESTVYGHPGQPKDGPPAPTVIQSVKSGNFGLSFEEQGLRAKVSLER